MRPKDRAFAREIDMRFRMFEEQKYILPGIQTPQARESLIEQIIESSRRNKYISVINKRKLSALNANPSSDYFDPLKAAILYKRQGQIDEAFWLVFLSVHFGKHRRSGWRLVRDIYGQLDDTALWNWTRTSHNPTAFRQWLADNQDVLRQGRVSRGFGNHRKYQSLDANSDVGTGNAVETYIKWVDPLRTHRVLIKEAQDKTNGDTKKTFDYLYHSMDAVKTFGRLAKFDYLTMIGKLELAPIEPGSTYMKGATGPFLGAQLLFGKDISVKLNASIIDGWLVELDTYLNVGMQVLEDALCNWQKSPNHFRRFRG